MAWRLAILIYAWRCVAIRDGGTDHIGLDDPVFTISKMLEKDAKDDADYMDCLQRWESERRKQIAFLSGFNHLVSAKRRVQRLHISMRTLGHSRNVTLLVSELHQGLSWLSSASVKYAERLKMYVDSLHPRLSEQCKRSTFRADDLRDEIVGVVGARRRSATLATMTMDARRRAVPERRSGFGRFLHTTPAPKIVEPTRPAREQELKVTTSEVPDVVVTSPVKLRQKPEANSTKSNGTEGNTTKAITTEANSTQATRTEATNNGTQANGTQANGTQANGTASKSTQTTDAANGTKTNGTAANSTKATSNGTQANGTQANGTASKSTQATDAANGTKTNGTAANSTKATRTEATNNGTQANGTQANGTQANGTASKSTQATDAANGTKTNGTAANSTKATSTEATNNGTQANGTQANGTASKSTQATDVANGTKTNGTAANSTKATSTEATNNGKQANGTQATDAANSTQANGTAANDTKVINTEANSTKANGTDGTQANATQANRTTANGTAANGTKPTSTATDAANRTTDNGTANSTKAINTEANSTKTNGTNGTQATNAANRTTANGTATNDTNGTANSTQASGNETKSTKANGTAANGTASRANRKQANSTEVNSTEATGTEAKTNQAFTASTAASTTMPATSAITTAAATSMTASTTNPSAPSTSTTVTSTSTASPTSTFPSAKRAKTERVIVRSVINRTELKDNDTFVKLPADFKSPRESPDSNGTDANGTANSSLPMPTRMSRATQAALANDREATSQVLDETQFCDTSGETRIVNDPADFKLPCVINGKFTRCQRWLLRPARNHDKIMLQSFWLVAFLGVMLVLLAFLWYRQSIKQRTDELKKLGQELAPAAETLGAFLGGTSSGACVVDVTAALIPVTNVIIYALATEEQENSVYIADNALAKSLSKWCEYGHDYWLVGSVGLLMVLQVLRAVAAQWSPKYAVHGKHAALWYLATDFSAMGDNVAIVLSLWSLAYCKAVHWNWMIFSFVRVIEILGRWEIGVNFYGLPNEGSDRSMIYALVVFGAVIWILIGSLFHVVNAANDASRWDFAQVQGEKSEPWQRFESIPSSMFYALLNLNKKNPLAYVYQDWYEKLLVIFVNVFCVPLFSLVSSMIGTTITAMILSKDPDADEQAGKEEEEEEGDEEEEEEEEDEEVEDEEVEPPEEPAVPLRQQLAEFWKSLTWEDHLHPAAMAVLGFGSLFFYGICSAQRPMRWLFFAVEEVPPWANPCVDGAVGILFLLDWLRGLAPPKPGPEAEEGLLSESSKTASGFSPWRHMAYFLASVPGIVHLVLFMANGDKNGSGISGVGNGFYSLCCLWRIYLLERWLEHPFWSAMEALYAGRKQLVTTGAVSIFFWYLGAHLLYFTEFDNPDAKIREFYGSVARAIWACSIYLNGEWVFCDFSWAGKAVGGFIVLFGVSIVVVPMSVFTFNFLTNIQGDFYETKVWHLKAEPADLWQLKLMPKDDAPVWRKQLFRLLYEHLQKLEKCLKAKDKGQDSPKWELSQGFLLFKWVSITASVVFVLITIMENSEYMNTDNCVEGSARNPLFHGPDGIQRCKDFFSRLDHVEYSVDLVFLHFFILEFIMRCVCLRWRHLISELGLAEMLSITGLVASLTDYREVALHHPEQHKEWTYKLAIGSVVSLRLCRLVCVGSYFGLLRALRKVVAVSQWSLLKSFYFLVAVWFTHAMLLHFTEFHNHTKALAGAQVLPSIEAQFVRHQEGYATLVEELQKHSFLQISGFASNASASNLSLVNVTNVANVTNVTNVTNSTSSEVPRHYQVIPTPRNQSARFGDYLGAMQYSLQHLAGDYPMVEYTGAGKLVLMLGLVIGTCAITAWTAVFSSAMVNYLANEAEEDYLAKAASHRMLVAIEVVMRLQQQWRRRKRRREAAIARGEPPVNDLERQALGFRTKVRRLLFRQGALGKALIFVFQVTLVVNIVANLLHSLPEFRDSKQVEPVRWRVEAVCDLIFLVELILYLIAGKGRQGVRWVFGRTVDMVCLVPGLVALWHMVNRIQKLEDLDMELLGRSSEVFKSNDTTDFQMLLDTLQMIRVVRILFWHQWQRKVHVVLSGIAQTGPILVIPAIMSSLIWIMTSALFVWMENVYNGPSKDFFTSVPTSMYWTSSFLIGEWTLADFSPGGGNRVCIAICLFGTMGFAIPMGLMMEGVQQAITLDHFESTPLQELDAISMADEAVKEAKSIKGAAAEADKPPPRLPNRALGSDKHEQLKRAARVAAMTKRMNAAAGSST